MLIFRGVVYICIHHTTIWFDLKFAISIWHDMQTPQVLCGNTCKTQEKEVLSWCILLIGIPNVMFSPVLSAEQLPNARAHVHLWLHRWPANKSFHAGFRWANPLPSMHSKVQAPDVPMKSSPDTWPAPCLMGGSSNCLPGNAWIQVRNSTVLGGTRIFWISFKSVTPSNVIPLHFLYIPAQYSNSNRKVDLDTIVFNANINHDSSSWIITGMNRYLSLRTVLGTACS